MPDRSVPNSKHGQAYAGLNVLSKSVIETLRCLFTRALQPKRYKLPISPVSTKRLIRNNQVQSLTLTLFNLGSFPDSISSVQLRIQTHMTNSHRVRDHVAHPSNFGPLDIQAPFCLPVFHATQLFTPPEGNKATWSYELERKRQESQT